MSVKDDLGLNCGGNCTGACCRVAFLPLRDRDHAVWAYLHGMRVYKIVGHEEYRVLYQNKCQMLDACGKCTLYGDPKRPEMCEKFQCYQMPDYEEFKVDVEVPKVPYQPEARP